MFSSDPFITRLTKIDTNLKRKKWKSFSGFYEYGQNILYYLHSNRQSLFIYEIILIRSFGPG